MKDQRSHPPTHGRRALIRSLAVAPALATPFARHASAQAFPAKPITLIIPFPPGGATDNLFRAMSQVVSKDLGQPVVIANRPGVGGTLGPTTMAASSAPDGYTVAVLPASLYRLPHLQKVNWDPVKDFTFVIGVTTYVYAVVVAADAPWKTLAEFVAHAKANPGKVSYGTTGTGTSGHIAMERLARSAGIKLNFVPFKGSAEWQVALIGGHIQAVSDAGWGTMANAGRIRVLATSTEQRLAPSVPTLRELGHDVTSMSMLGIGGPKGMDPAIVRTLHDAFLKATKDPKVQEILKNENMPLIHLDSAAYARYAAEQFESDRRWVKELGLDLQ